MEEVEIDMEQQESPVILLIEDNERDVELIRWTFKQSATTSQLVWCRNRRETQEYLASLGTEGQLEETRLPAFIFLDLHLGEEYGLDVLEDLRADERLQDVPIYIWASAIDWQDIEKAAGQEVSGYILKPANVKQLGMDMSRLLSTHSPGKTS